MPTSFRHHLLLAVLAGLALGSMGCVHHVHQRPTRVVTKSPPPFAPAHGHRHVHHERTLVFDTNLDCYTVVGHSDHFFHRDHYYRWRAERWERSLRAAGPWRSVKLDRLPPGLRGWHTRHHAARLERRARSERELARQQRANELAQERAQEARRLERRAERERREREERRTAERLEREREKRRAERLEREREERRAETRLEREREKRRAREREKRRAKARLEREQEERRAEERQRREHEVAIRERNERKLEAVERRRAEVVKRKADERKEKAKEQEPAEDDYRARRRAGKEQGVRSDEKTHPAEQASSRH
jgi:hypothetical protein